MKVKNILLIIILALVLSSCGYNTPSPMTTSHSISDNGAPQLTAFDIIDSESFDLPLVLVDEQDITAVLKAIQASNSETIEIVFEIENRTEHMYYFDVNRLSFNCYMLPEYNDEFEVVPNSIDEYMLKIDYKTLSLFYGINNSIKQT